MEVRKIQTITGPNVYHHKPVLMATLDIGGLAETHSAELPGFAARLVALLPGLHEHHCSPGHPGGFELRLERGTYLAHIIEHVALELSQLAGIPVGYGKTQLTGEPGVSRIVVRYRSEEGMKFLLHEAVALVQASIDGRGFDVDDCVRRAKDVIRRAALGPSTSAILEAARRRGIPCKRIGPESLVQLGWGRHRAFIQATTTSRTSDIAVDIAQNKELTKDLLRRASLPVPGGREARSADEAVRAWREIGLPVAVKPRDGHQGKGITLDIDDEDAVREAYLRACEESPVALVEEYYPGKDIRVLVVGGKTVAASHRTPAFVRGDGTLSISLLIDRENEDPRRGNGHEAPLTRIEKDGVLLSLLRRKGLSLDTVPAPGEVVLLRETANLSTGGCAIDLTDKLHPSLRRLAEHAAGLVGLDVCGVDLIVEDPSLPAVDQSCAILEVNAGPGIRMHHYPAAGEPRDAGDAILESLFPGGGDGRIPVAAITGTNGKTTVTRLLAHMIGRSGKVTGMTTSDGIFVGGELLADGDTTGPRSAEAVLSNPAVEVAVLETARGGIVRGGLGYDWSDVGILTNIQLDHVGQDGIETIDDILRIKSLVAERVRQGGTLVLNAEDMTLLQLTGASAVREFPKRLALFALDPKHFAIRRHRAAGGLAYFERDGVLVEAGPDGEIEFLTTAEVPLTVGGTARFHVQNALAAIAGARALGVPVESIRSALRDFDPHVGNAGRVNVFRAGRGFLVADYGHNQEAIRAIGAMARAWRRGRVHAVLGLPGDRSTGTIQAAARAAARAFDRVYVREDKDRRGRRPGETAELVCQAVLDETPGKGCIVEHDALKCLELAVSEMRDGEVVVYFYEEYGELGGHLRAVGAERVDYAELLLAKEPRKEAV